MVMLNDLDRFHLVMDVIDRVPGLAAQGRAPAPGDGRPAARGPRLDARARRGRSRRCATGPGRSDAGVLVVNAGSTSLKLVARRRATSASSAVESLDDARRRTIDAVGHRVVHGGARFREPVVIDDDVVARDRASWRRSRRCTTRPRSRRSTRRARRCPSVPHVAVFDTAFHATIPRRGRDVRRPARAGARSGASGATASTGSPCSGSAEQVAGARGSSSATSAAAARSRPCSTAARSTRRWASRPLEGVPMATRSGLGRPRDRSLYVLRERGLDPDEARPRARARVGARGARRPRRPARLRACSRTASRRRSRRWPSPLGGLDVIAFSGGVGENREDVRGAVADAARLPRRLRVEVVPAREELVIARAVRHLLAAG